MKTDDIKEAIEKVQKEDPKLYQDVVEYVSSIEIKLVFIRKVCIKNIDGPIL